MGHRLVTPPAAEPVSLAEVKTDLRVDHTDDDTRLTSLITEARQSIDGPKTWFQRTLITQTWEYILDEFPSAEVELPTLPVQSITSIKYDDADGIEQAIAVDEYQLDALSEPAWVFPVTSWTVTTLSAFNAIRIRYVAGYGSAGSDVPGPIKAAIRLMVQEAYDGTDTRAAVRDLLSQYRLFY